MNTVLSASAVGFESFFRANPWLYHRLVAEMRSQIARGWKRLSISHAWETVRYDAKYGLIIGGNEQAKMPNEHRAYYARVILAKHPEWSDMLRTRSQTHEYRVDQDCLARLGLLTPGGAASLARAARFVDFEDFVPGPIVPVSDDEIRDSEEWDQADLFDSLLD